MNAPEIGEYRERLATLETQVQASLEHIAEQNKAIIALQDLVTTMRITWAGERMKVAILVASFGAAANAAIGLIVVYFFRNMLK